MMIEFYFQSYKYVNFTAQRGISAGSESNNGMCTVVTRLRVHFPGEKTGK